MEKKQKRILLIAFVILLVISLLFILHRCRDEPIPTADSKILDFVPASENDKITIPGVTGLYLQHGQLNQTVDFYNPDNNKCYFVIALYLSDDTLIYKSDYIAPGEKITDITLLQQLERGIYKNCLMSYSCYSLEDKSPLNGANQKIEINSR